MSSPSTQHNHQQLYEITIVATIYKSIDRVSESFLQQAHGDIKADKSVDTDPNEPMNEERITNHFSYEPGCNNHNVVKQLLLYYLILMTRCTFEKDLLIAKMTLIPTTLDFNLVQLQFMHFCNVH